MSETDVQSKKQFEQEYEAFLNAPPMTPPSHISKRIRQTILKDINPSLPASLLQLLLSHVVFVTLLMVVCPHFGVSIIPGFKGLPAVFAIFGRTVCKVCCGFTIMGVSLFLSTRTLPIGHLKRLRTYRPLIVALLSLTTLFTLAFIGGKIRWMTDAPAWFLGACVGGYILFKVRKNMPLKTTASNDH